LRGFRKSAYLFSVTLYAYVESTVRLYSDSIRFFPSDLITFLEGEFVAWMERAYAARGQDRASDAPPTLSTFAAAYR